MLEVAIIVYLGEQAQDFIHDYFGPITIVTVIVIMIGYIGYRSYKARQWSSNKKTGLTLSQFVHQTRSKGVSLRSK